MVRFSSLLLFLSIVHITLFASHDSTLYNSRFEEQLFKNIQDSVTVSPLDIMLAVNYKNDNEKLVQKRIDGIVASLKNQGLEGKKTKKQIQEIYKSIHKEELKKYVEDAGFNELFESGDYNCVSATALYAMVLQEFNIDYEIRETPTHVYLVADPSDTKVLIESTLPQNGTFEFDYKTKKEYVNYLVSSKLISKEEFENTSVDKLFEEHYDQNKIIDLTQLAALMYYNEGVTKFNTRDYESASLALKKANTIYPSVAVGLLYNSALATQLNSEIATKKYNPLMLASFVNFNRTNDEYSVYGIDFFKNIGNQLMIENPDVPKYKSYFESFKSMLDDSVDINPFSQTYYVLLAYSNELNENYAAALQNMNYSYISNSENLSTKEAILGLIRNHLVNDKEHEATTDSLDMYFDIFPFLEENTGLQEYYSYCKMRVIREIFLYNMPTLGYEKLSAFEESLQYANAYSHDKEYLENMYLDIAGYYARKNNMNMAAKSLQRGLQFEPNSMLLKNRLMELSQFRSQANTFEQAIVYSNKSREEQFKEDFNKSIVACWEIDGALNGADEVEYDESLKIMTYKDNKLTYIIDGKTESGKYSIRTKSRLMYLVPDRNKEDYTIFKVESIDNREMILRPFVNGKLTGTRIYMSKCS